MSLVTNNGATVHFGYGPDEFLVLPPGTSEVDERKWDAVKDHPLCKRELKRKRLVVVGAQQPEPEPEPKPEDPAE